MNTFYIIKSSDQLNEVEPSNFPGKMRDVSFRADVNILAPYQKQGLGPSGPIIKHPSNLR